MNSITFVAPSRRGGVRIGSWIRHALPVAALALAAACAGDAGPTTPDPEYGTIRGTVTDDAGATVANAAVELSWNEQTLRTTSTGADGVYMFASVAPGTYTLTVTPPAGFTSGGGATRTVTVAADAETNADALVVARAVVTGSIRGTVIDYDAGPLFGVDVLLTADGQDPRSANTGIDGVYTFADLPPGTYGLALTPPSGFTLKWGGAATVTVQTALQTNVSQFVLAHDSCAIARPDFGGLANDKDLALFDYDVDAPLNLQQTIDSVGDGVQFSSILYTSPDGGPVPGILVEPVGRTGPLPAIVLMHAGGFPATLMKPYAAQFAHGGAVVIGINAPYWRRGGAPYLWMNGQDRAEQIQMIKDLRRAIDILTARPDVDDDRIGFIGHSYGAIIGAQLIGVDPRIDAAILATPSGGQVTHLTSTVNLPDMSDMTCAQRNVWFDAMVQIEPIRFIPHASGTEILFQIALLDDVILAADSHAVYEAAPEPKEVRYYDTGHGMDLQSLVDRYDWLQEKIGLDP